MRAQPFLLGETPRCLASLLELFAVESRTPWYMRPRAFSRLITLLLLGYVTLCVVAGVFVAETTLHPGRRPLSAKDDMHAQRMASNHGYVLSAVTISARDGVPLSAWTVRPRNHSGRTVILLHGLGDNRVGMIGYAELLLAHGFSVLMPDARAHGASGGQLATYGLLESDDIHRWFEWLQQNEHPACIFGFGESMGAAQLLQSLQNQPHLCAVAAESPFSTFREIAYDRVGQFFHTGPWLGRTVFRPIVEVAFGYARWKYGMNFEQVAPEKIVAESKVPILLIHGREDRNIPIRHSRRMAVHNPTLALWEVRDADHCGAIATAPQELERRLMNQFQVSGQRTAEGAPGSRPVFGR